VLSSSGSLTFPGTATASSKARPTTKNIIMPPIPPQDLVYGWVFAPDDRGTRNIFVSSLSTIWFCTWTSLCLNIPSRETRHRRRLWLLSKVRWQLFAIFFPEVLVATAAEQWLSARQSARALRPARLSSMEYPPRLLCRHGRYRRGHARLHPFPC
jgi:hypothetical protein